MIIGNNDVNINRISDDIYVYCTNCGKNLIKIENNQFKNQILMLERYQKFEIYKHICPSAFAIMANDCETLSGGEKQW